jgi:hypothetical protein
MEDGRFEGIKDPMRLNNNRRPSFPTDFYDNPRVPFLD